ncbi:MFS transporter [Eremomyces bilateralis CBS 781.70]|uniref:MFS transporter n=1 Tax=Eremomyces bilateralis CBS 781.70 TaxID=1392243 RepID=A0A6G1G367_9PEZI|nr:MFS transporter [Eremomyces bilateralis CBS 781.70]KAF1812555.1 MFS transporter [Eremomyces bilateralis CBS 781.70]
MASEQPNQNEKIPARSSAVETTEEKKALDLEKHGDIVVGSSIPTIMRDGIRLHPQPTSDPLDPLNWSKWKKGRIVAIVMGLYFMFTYVTTTTVPAFLEIQELYNITDEQLNWTVAIPALGLAAGPLLWSSLADIFGRRIIFIIGTVVALAATIGAGLAPNYGGYMAARFFQGLGTSPGATVGLAIINDMYFEYERGQKVGLWVLAIDMGLLVGPLIGGFAAMAGQAWVQWLTAILLGVLLIAEVFFLTETLYPRNQMLIQMPYTETGPETIEVDSEAVGAMVDMEKIERKNSVANEVDLKRTTALPFINITPVPGMKHPTPWDSAVRFCLTWKYLPVTITVVAFCYVWYWWVLSVITFIPFAYPDYKPHIQGLLFIGLILGTLVGEIFFSGTLSDKIILRLAKKQGGVRVPEMRLWLVYPAILSSSTGLILWGVSIDRGYHWMVGQVAFFLFAAGIQIGNTVTAAYIVDCYPLQSMAIITFYSVLLNLSAFINPFFIAPWIDASGYTWTFAAQGIITFFGCIPLFAGVHFFGSKLRRASGAPNWVNPEFDSIL